MILFEFDNAIDYVTQSLDEIKQFITSIYDFVNSLFNIFPTPFSNMFRLCFLMVFAIALYKIFTKRG